MECIDLRLSHLTWLDGELPPSFFFLAVITAHRTNFPLSHSQISTVHPSLPPLNSVSLSILPLVHEELRGYLHLAHLDLANMLT